MSSRKISDLDLRLQPLCQMFLDNCAMQGIDILITCTWRSPAEQDALYAIGRTKPGRHVTNARAGESSHNVVDQMQRPAAQAFDVVPIRNGKLIWGTSGDGIDQDPTDDDTDDLELWQRIGAIGETVGLEWAGRWTRMREFPHFQMKS